jgi:hypothetical protein
MAICTYEHMPYLFGLTCWHTTLYPFNTKQSHWCQRKTKQRKRKVKTKWHVIMVKFDIIIMMPTLSIHTKLFLNQTSWSFCLVSKNTWRWSSWSLPTLQKSFQILIISIQSCKVKTETRSSILEFEQNHLHFPNQSHSERHNNYTNTPEIYFAKIQFNFSCGHLVKHLAGRNQLKHESLFKTVFGLTWFPQWSHIVP